MMKMQRYDFELIFTPGNHLILADALSIGSASTTEDDFQGHVNMVPATRYMVPATLPIPPGPYSEFLYHLFY